MLCSVLCFAPKTTKATKIRTEILAVKIVPIKKEVQEFLFCGASIYAQQGIKKAHTALFLSFASQNQVYYPVVAKPYQPKFYFVKPSWLKQILRFIRSTVFKGKDQRSFLLSLIS